MNLSIVTKEMFAQNQMNIYQNENNDVFMTREQIGLALEYTHPREAVKNIHSRNNERLNQFSRRAQIDTPSGKQETVIYSEKGIYEILRYSKQPKADEFYDWVYDLLSKLRKGEVQVQQPKSQLEVLQLTVDELTSHDKRISHLEENMRIDGIQERKLQNKAKSIAIESLGGMNSNAYKNVSRKVFSGIWRDFNNHFQLPRYSELPRKQFEEGLRFLGMWQPNTSLRIEIEEFNRQLEVVM